MSARRLSDQTCESFGMPYRGEGRAEAAAPVATEEPRPGARAGPKEVVRVSLPTPFGEFDVRAFECASGFVYLALTRGAPAGEDVLTRVHSECLTGDSLGSLRCDCGTQLRSALRSIAAAGRGVLVYVTGHEGRGIGIVNKLRAYLEQDAGADTVDANLRLGLAVDARQYEDAAGVLHTLGVRSVQLMTNNPAKGAALAAAGIHVAGLRPLATSSHVRNATYLQTKQERMAHVQPRGVPLGAIEAQGPPDAMALLGRVVPPPHRPYVVLKYAQTLDGRIATMTGDSKWISGTEERTLAHALRAACDGVLVGVGTVLHDDPQLTVRMVRGTSPIRVVLDTTLRTPASAKILGNDAATVVLTTDAAPRRRREELQATGTAVRVVPPGPGGVDLRASLDALGEFGVRTLLVEGGSRVLTSLLAAGFVDRLVVSVSPTIIGSGTEAVGSLGTRHIAEGLRLDNGSVHLAGDDVLLAWDLVEGGRSRP
jgi:GTP cyclohydrolase II